MGPDGEKVAFLWLLWRGEQDSAGHVAASSRSDARAWQQKLRRKLGHSSVCLGEGSNPSCGK